MAQQASFLKLKEQIEAAKRGLTEMSGSEIPHNSNNLSFVSPSNGLSPSASPNMLEPDAINPSSDDISRGDTVSTNGLNGTKKIVPRDTDSASLTPSNDSGSWSEDFQFFYRSKQPKEDGGLALDPPLEDVGKVDLEDKALVFERFEQRLAILEGDAAQSRKYVLELINLLSQLDFSQETEDRKPRPSQRLNRRYIFWFVMSFLALAWFGLTPSGHTAIGYFLAFV